jgi:Tfp pilus assembly protein PilO
MLQDWAQRLAIPGMPEWTGLAALLVLLLLAGCLLVMPFSVFGLKGRLDAIEAQLDELRADLRGLSARLAESRREAARLDPEFPHEPPAPAPSGRAEPRITWPRPR